jgi:hypothetical protein
VSILVEIAERADVSVEGVVRVLTREPVSDAIKERVLDVLDDLTPEQTRAVQRFALAALHDDLQRGGDSSAVEDTAVPDPSQLALPVAAAAPDLLPAPGPGSDAALVQLSSVLGELAEAVRDLRRETDAERRERVDDLAVLIDLITTGWQGLDARLGRIERQVSRLESGRRGQIAPAPVRVVPAAVEEAPAAAVAPAAAAEPLPVPPVEPAEPRSRDRLPVVAALTLVGAGVVTLAVLQLASGEPDLERLVSPRETSATATEGVKPTIAAPTTGGTETRPPATTPRPPAAGTTAPTSTSRVLGTTSAGTTRPKPPTVPADPQTMSAPPAKTTRPATTSRPGTATPTGFKPTRNWAWAPVEGADYYDVVFTWSGRTFYRGSPTEPRLTLPSTVVFRPGAYRWVVRPGFGARGARNLGPPVVDSPFAVS